MNKKDKIRKIFLKLNPSGKDNVRKVMSEKFNISVDTAKNHWIYNGNIPEQNIDDHKDEGLVAERAYIGESGVIEVHEYKWIGKNMR